MKVEHFHMLLTDCILSSVNCLSKSTGSWLSDGTSQGWSGHPGRCREPSVTGDIQGAVQADTMGVVLRRLK